MSIVLNGYVVKTQLQKQAKSLKKEKNISLGKAYHLIAQENGFNDWDHLKKVLDYEQNTPPKIVQLENKYVKANQSKDKEDHAALLNKCGVTWLSRLGHSYRSKSLNIGKNVIQLAIDNKQILDADWTEKRLLDIGLVEDTPLVYYFEKNDRFFDEFDDNESSDYHFYRLISLDTTNPQEIETEILESFMFGPWLIWINGKEVFDRSYHSSTPKEGLPQIEASYCRRYGE
jgi:hypothetical protein